MLRVAAERDVLKVKDEGFISPTYARDLAEGIAGLVETELYGRYHLTNSGLASGTSSPEKSSLSGTEVEVVPIPSSDLPLPATRPANGVLSTLGSSSLRHWREVLADYLEREGVVR
jgi:dTDP-4-dehydrorhamnose reductase